MIPPDDHSLADEQAALRRIATLVARAGAEDEVFATVAEEVGRLLGVDLAELNRYEPDGAITIRASWAAEGEPFPAGTRWPPEVVGIRVPTNSLSIGRLVFESGRPARIDDWGGAQGVIAEAIGRLGIRSSAGAPVVVAGRLWGYMTVNSSQAAPLPESTERRLADFTELVATAIANSEARAEIARLADEQAALRRVAMLVARGVPPSEVFAAVTEEIVGLLGAEVAGMSRYDAGDVQTVVAAWPPDREHLQVGTRLPLSEGDNIARRVLETGEPVRLADWNATSGPVASLVRRLGVRSSVGCPIVVGGRLWGVMIVDSRAAQPLPEGVEQRLASFTELVATAVANSEANRERRRLAEEQSALRRVATYVAQGLKPDDGLAVVAAEVGLLLDAEVVHLNRLDRDGAVTTVAAWSQHGNHVPAGSRWTLEGDSATALVLQTGRPARIDDYRDAPGAIAAALRQLSISSAVGSPIVVEGRVWGAIVVASTSPEPPPADTEDRLAGFTELIGTAVANAHTSAEVSRLAEEQAALRRVATLVARESSPAELFAAVGEEVGRVLGADLTNVMRYEPDGSGTMVAGWSTRGSHLPVGTRVDLEGDTVAALVRRKGTPARMDTYEGVRGAIAERMRQSGVRSSLGAPIVAGGRLWGAVLAGSSGDALAPTAESRIAEFTELVATAIANAESRGQLAASRARVVAAGDEERRRIERNLHDGAQQRLVSLGLQLRMAAAMAPAEELAGRLKDIGSGLTGVLADLQEISRGLHPAILSTGGLGSALGALARRSAVPVELEVRVERRLPEPIEVAAYYVASEALANAAKHADASVVRISAEESDQRLLLSIRDDGVGGADPAGGSGLIGLRDRIEAAGGRIEVESPAGEGTTLLVTIPVPTDP